MFNGGLEALGFEEFDQRRGEKRGDHREVIARGERIYLGADQGERFRAVGEDGADVERVIFGGNHGQNFRGRIRVGTKAC